MDITSVTTLLSGIKSATDIAKLMRDSGVTLEKAESKLRLAELISALADVKIEASTIQDLLRERDEKIKSLEEALRTHGSLTWEEPCYWLGEGQTRTPYCQPCYDSGRKLSRLHTDNQGFFQCRVCEKSFTSNQRQAAENAKVQAHAESYRRKRGY